MLDKIDFMLFSINWTSEKGVLDLSRMLTTPSFELLLVLLNVLNREINGFETIIILDRIVCKSFGNFSFYESVSSSIFACFFTFLFQVSIIIDKIKHLSIWD